MKKSHFLLLILNFSISISIAQKINSSNIHENYRKVIEIQSNQYLIIETIYNSTFEIYSGKCFILDSQGNITNEYSYNNEGENVSFQTAFFINGVYYLFGSLSDSEKSYLLEIKLNIELEMIHLEKYSIPDNKTIGYLNTILDSDSNFIHTGYGNENYSMFLYKNSMGSDSLDSKFFNTPFQFAFQLHESSDSSKYFLLLDGYISNMAFGGMLQLNKQFETLNFTYIPHQITKVYSSVYFKDSLFIISGLSYQDFSKLYVVKTNVEGALLETDTFFKIEGSNEFPAFSPGISYKNNFYYLGSTSNMDFSNPNQSSNDSWFHLIKMDENLNVSWEKWYGGDAYYSLNSVLATSDGGCLMVGTKYPHGIGNQFIQGHFIKVDANGNVQWTQDIETHDISFNLYPNPTSSFFTIENNDFSIKKIELFDLSGKIISVIDNCENANIQINLENFSNGIYFAKITTSKGITTQKVVKQ